MDGLGSTVEEALLTETESVRFWFTTDLTISVPIIVAASLLARCVVSVSLNVHFLMLGALLETAFMGVEHLLGVSTVASRATESWVVTLLLDLVRPLILTLVALSERLTLVGGVLTLTDIVKFVSKASQILSLNNLLHWVRSKVGSAIGMVISDILFEAN